MTTPRKGRKKSVASLAVIDGGKEDEPCEHELRMLGFPHTYAEDARDSFARGLDEGLIDEEGHLTCACSRWRRSSDVVECEVELDDVVCENEVPDAVLLDDAQDLRTEVSTNGVVHRADAPLDGIRDPDCTLCRLHAGATTVCVGGQGPPDASIMLIGQNPGENEDQQGVPFVGAAGKLLDEYLESAGLARADVYVTNIVKCLTPKNRAPSAKEITACGSYWLKEIATYRPQVIVPLGGPALQALCGKEYKITSDRGKPLALSAPTFAALRALGAPEDYVPEVIATFHPAAVLNSPNGPRYTQLIVDDLRRALMRVAGTYEDVAVPWAYVPDLTLGDGVKMAAQIPGLHDAEFAYDIETNALPIWHPDFLVRMLSIDGGEGEVAVFRGADVAVGIEMLATAHDEGATLTGHNAAGFDRVGINKVFNVNLRNSDDTMLMAHLLNEDGPKGLEDLCVTRLNLRPWKQEVTWSWADGPGPGDWEKAGLYSAQDARYQRMLHDHLSAELRKDERLYHYYKMLDLPRARALAAVEQRGLYLAPELMGRSIGEFTVQQIVAETRVRQIVGNPDFNPGSPGQVRKIVFERMGLPPQEWTDSMESSTNELSLKKLRQLLRTGAAQADGGLEFIEAVLSYRNAQKMLGYLNADVERTTLAPDGRAHFWYSSTKSVSRSSSDGQQRPRDPRLRDIASAPPGRALVCADFSQMEMRLAAHLSQDPALLQIYREGGDLHKQVAMIITGKPEYAITKVERDDAKPWGFSLLYGAEEYTIESIMLKDYDIYLPRYEVTRRRDGFHSRFSGLQNWYQAVWDEARATGQVRTMTGRVRRLPAIYSPEDGARLEAFRQGINYTDQAPGYDIAGIALVMAVGMKMDVTWFLHDGIYVETEVADVGRVKEQFAAIESAVPVKLKELFGVELSVPLPLEVTVKYG